MPTDNQILFVWIDSEMAARNTYMAPGTTMFFMERNQPRLYARTTGISGETSSFRIFNLVEEFPPAEETAEYVTAKDLGKAMEDLKAYIDNAIKPRSTRSPKETK